MKRGCKKLGAVKRKDWTMGREHGDSFVYPKARIRPYLRDRYPLEVLEDLGLVVLHRPRRGLKLRDYGGFRCYSMSKIGQVNESLCGVDVVPIKPGWKTVSIRFDQVIRTYCVFNLARKRVVGYPFMHLNGTRPGAICALILPTERLMTKCILEAVDSSDVAVVRMTSKGR